MGHRRRAHLRVIKHNKTRGNPTRHTDMRHRLQSKTGNITHRRGLDKGIQSNHGTQRHKPEY